LLETDSVRDYAAGMSITYYRDEHRGYLGVTGESPKGFQGIVFVGRGPEPRGAPETVHE
jgi:hypothetical protein